MVGALLECSQTCLQFSQPGHPDQIKGYGYIKTDLILNEIF